jgi:hypothetical protein
VARRIRTILTSGVRRTRSKISPRMNGPCSPQR